VVVVPGGGSSAVVSRTRVVYCPRCSLELPLSLGCSNGARCGYGLSDGEGQYQHSFVARFLILSRKIADLQLVGADLGCRPGDGVPCLI